MNAVRIALIHALAHSVAPINEALGRDWPEAQRMNLLDDSLSADLAASPGGLDAAMTQRFITLADYAVDAGAHAILFTCSAFGPCIEAVKRRHAGLPVLKPNEAMIDEAVVLAGAAAATDRPAVGLVASFGPTLQSMPGEVPAALPLRCVLAEGALEALNRGEVARHVALVADAAARLLDAGCGVVALAQFSLARAREAVQARCPGVPVLTTVDSAVRALRVRLRA